MTNYVASMTDAQVFEALWDWLMLLFPTGVEVVKGDSNRVPNPLSPSMLLQRINTVRLTTNESAYTDDLPTAKETTTQQIDYSIQLDVYGPSSADQMRVVSTLFRSDQACQFFTTYNVQPLYLDDPRCMPIVNGEEQYEQRWMTTLHLQFNPSVSVPAEFMDTITTPTLINVEATYPV